MITVGDYLYLFTEICGDIEIYNCEAGEVVFKGRNENDIPPELWATEVATVDWPSNGTVCINVEEVDE